MYEGNTAFICVPGICEGYTVSRGVQDDESVQRANGLTSSSSSNREAVQLDACLQVGSETTDTYKYARVSTTYGILI